jgi:hypothetical protein
MVAHGFSSRHTLPSSSVTGTRPTHHTTKMVTGAMLRLSTVDPNPAAAATNSSPASTHTRSNKVSGPASTARSSHRGARTHGTAANLGRDHATPSARNETTTTTPAV